MLTKNTTKTFIYFLSVFVCFACSDLADETAINISDEFFIDMFQVMDQSNFEIILEISTDEQFDCQNYQISIDRSNSDNTIELVFDDIIIPEVCEEGSGTAYSEIVISEQDLNQRIKFIFTDEIYDEAALTQLENKVELDLISNNGIKFFINELTRIPSNSITLIFEYNSPNEDMEVQGYLNELSELLQPKNLNDGYYGHFSVTEDNFEAKANVFS